MLFGGGGADARTTLKLDCSVRGRSGPAMAAMEPFKTFAPRSLFPFAYKTCIENSISFFCDTACRRLSFCHLNYNFWRLQELVGVRRHQR